DVLLKSRRNPAHVPEERWRLLKRGDVMGVTPALIYQVRIGSSKKNCCFDENAFQVAATRLALCENTLQRSRVSSQLRQRRSIRLPTLRVPFGAVDIDETTC